MSLYDQDFKHYMDLDVTKEDTERMAIVKGVEIKGIRLNDIVEYIYERLDPRNNIREPTVKLAFDALPTDTKQKLATSMFIYRYCIHRILTHYHVYDSDNWQYHLTDDYYSQEVQSIKLKPGLAEDIDRCLRKMITLKDSRKIEMVLELEFRRVLPEIRDREWSISKVHKEQFKFTNESLLSKCRKEDLSYLESYKLPRALCVAEQGPDDTVYRVIDGYHRLADIFERDEPCCLVIYCDE
jgi:hypothetical protein